MHVSFERRPRPGVAGRPKAGPPTTTAEHVGINGRIALALTTAVGTMWCAYAFAVLALVALPQAIEGGLLPLVQWISQTFIQLVMLSVIMVGQNVLARTADKRARMTYDDADAAVHDAEQIQVHLGRQDTAINALLDKLERLETAIGSS
jgi:hypothetical protein